MPSTAAKPRVERNNTAAVPKQKGKSKEEKKHDLQRAKAMLDTDYLNYIAFHDPADIMKDSISNAAVECSFKIMSAVMEIAKNEIGFYGGMKHFFSSKSSGIGNEIRDFLKLKTREWVNNIIDKELKTFKLEKEEEISNDSSLSAKEKQKKKEEFDEEQKLKGIYLRETMYDEVKKDIEKRLENQSKKYAEKVDGIMAGEYGNKILLHCQKIFEEEFKKSKLKNYELSGGQGEEIAKEEAVMKLAEKSQSIGDKVFEEIKSTLIKKAYEEIKKERDQIINDLGGKYYKNKSKVAFDRNKDNPIEKAEDYIYGEDSGQFLSTGIQSREEKEEEIRRAVRKDVFVTTKANKGLYYLAKGVFSTVKENGDSMSLEGGLKIPVHEGVYIILNVNGEVEKADDHVDAKVEVSVGASGDVGIANISAEVGGYMEIQAKTVDDFANLISYTLYRQFRESRVVPHKLTDAIWGMGGKTGDSSYEEAETFGAMSERRLFGEDVEAENVGKLGLFGKIGAELGFEKAGVGVSAEVKGGMGREYSKKSFEETGQESRIGKIEDYKVGGQKSKGQITGNLTVSLGAEAALGGGGAELEINFRNGKISDLAVTLNGYLSIPGASEKTKKVLVYVLSAIKVVATNIKKWVSKMYKMKKEGTYSNSKLFQLIKQDAKLGTLEAFQVGFTGKPLNSLMDKIGDSAENISSNDIELEIVYEWEPGTYGEFSVAVKSKASVGADFGIGSFKVEKSKNIASWSTKDAKETQGNLLEKFAGGFTA